jgi:hypothetical protein
MGLSSELRDFENVQLPFFPVLLILFIVLPMRQWLYHVVQIRIFSQILRIGFTKRRFHNGAVEDSLLLGCDCVAVLVVPEVLDPSKGRHMGMSVPPTGITGPVTQILIPRSRS